MTDKKRTLPVTATLDHWCPVIAFASLSLVPSISGKAGAAKGKAGPVIPETGNLGLLLGELVLVGNPPVGGNQTGYVRNQWWDFYSYVMLGGYELGMDKIWQDP